MTRTKKPQKREFTDTPVRSAPAPGPALQQQIEERVVAEEPGTEVLAVEPAGSRRAPVLRIYLDHPNGVDLDLCARVTHHLRDLLGDYGVEVSSPGPERPLSKPEHYRSHVGRRVRVRTAEAVDGRNDFKGDLLGADDEGVSLAVDGGMVQVPYAHIRRANLIPQADGSRRTS